MDSIRRRARSFVNIEDIDSFMDSVKSTIPMQKSAGDRSLNGFELLLFPTRYSVGYAVKRFGKGDGIFTIDSASVPFVLRRIGHQQYRIPE
jgi:hypothetical protein